MEPPIDNNSDTSTYRLVIALAVLLIGVSGILLAPYFATYPQAVFGQLKNTLTRIMPGFATSDQEQDALNGATLITANDRKRETLDALNSTKGGAENASEVAVENEGKVKTLDALVTSRTELQESEVTPMTELDKMRILETLNSNNKN